jgi:hypothetical protein
VITPWFGLLKREKLMGWWKRMIESGGKEFPNEAGHIENFTIRK